MGLIQATTPTSAGFAQVFDTSGVVEYSRIQREKRQQRLAKSIMEHDPKGIWKRDLPKFQKKVSDYYKFLNANHEALLHTDTHMDVWQQKRDMENDLRNFSAFSQQAKDDYYKSVTQSMSKRYGGDRNITMVDQFLNQPSDAQYEDGSAWDSPLSRLERRRMIDPDAYVDAVERTADRSYELHQDAIAKAADKVGYIMHNVYNPESAKKALGSFWGLSDDPRDLTEDQEDVRAEYGSFDNFVQSTIESAAKKTEQRYLTPTAEGAESDADIKARAIMMPGAANIHSTYEAIGVPAVIRTKGRKKGTEISPAQIVPGDAPIKATNSMTYSGLRITSPNFGEAFNVTKGQSEDTRNLTDAKLVESGNYRIATEDMKLELYDKPMDQANRKKVGTMDIVKGQPIPTWEGMYHENINAKTISQHGALFLGSDQTIPFFQKIEGEDVTDIMQQYKAGVYYVPFDQLRDRVSQEIFKKTKMTYEQLYQTHMGTTQTTTLGTTAPAVGEVDVFQNID
jgi:hypothetical protein